MENLRTTPLYDSHQGLGARMVPFGGWIMPIQYSGILAEVKAVRESAGMFDVSHMGRITVEGPGAHLLLDWIFTGHVGQGMSVGSALYGLICNEAGGIIDDGVIYRLAPERFLLVANASNSPEILDWIRKWRDSHFQEVAIDDATDKLAMIALQGPGVKNILLGLAPEFEFSDLQPFKCAVTGISRRSVFIATTGYTGENGVELMPASEDASWLWELIRENGVASCGLGARDVLRLEAGLLLHGSDIGLNTNPVEARLERFIASEGDFCGSSTIRSIQEVGPDRNLVGFKTITRGPVPRPHVPIMVGGNVIGEVTSGGYSPTLDSNIGLGYVPVRFGIPGTQLQLDIRGKIVDAEVVNRRFYSRTR